MRVLLPALAGLLATQGRPSRRAGPEQRWWQANTEEVRGSSEAGVDLELAPDGRVLVVWSNGASLSTGRPVRESWTLECLVGGEVAESHQVA